jgi:hypothetical protein
LWRDDADGLPKKQSSEFDQRAHEHGNDDGRSGVKALRRSMETFILPARLEEMELSARAIIAKHAPGCEQGEPWPVIDLPDETPAPVRDAVEDAISVLVRLHIFIASRKRGDLDLAAFNALHLDAAFKRMQRRPLQPILDDGLRIAEGRSKGGRASKKKAGIVMAIRQILAANPDASAKMVWTMLEQYSTASPLEIGGHDVFVDGDTIKQEDQKTTKIRSIRFRTFQRYVSEAKKESQ